MYTPGVGFWRSLFRPWAGEAREVAPGLSRSSTGVQPPARDAAATVTASTALGLDAVFRAVQVIATGVDQLTLDAYRQGSVLSDKQTASWLRTPNVDESLSAFLGQTVASLALSGNAFWRVYRSASSADIVNLRVLPSAQVQVSIDPDTDARTYHYRGRDLGPRSIRHLAYLRIPGEARGLGPVQAAQQRLRGAVDLNQFASEWFDTSGVPGGVLSTDQHLTAEQATQWREQWTENQVAGGTAVLGAGLNYSTVHISPKDAQFLESQQFTTTALARLFGVPARLMLAAVEGGSLTYANLSQEDLSFVRWTLSLYTREIEEAFTALLPRGQVARFNLDALLRPDTLTRYQAHALALSNGFLTRDEVRAMEGLPPLPDGDGAAGDDTGGDEAA